MIFALGFIIAIGACLCIPQVWSKMETYFGRSKLYNGEETETFRVDPSREEIIRSLSEKNQNLVDNNQKLADQILELKAQPPIEYVQAEDPRLEPAVDLLLEHLKLIPDPGDMATWRAEYLSAVHKIANIRAFEIENDSIEEKVVDLDPGSLKYIPVI